MSLFRVFSKVYQLGWRNTLRQLTFHDDIAVGTLIGTDRNGNRYFENRSDINQPGYRDRWIEYSQGFTRNVSQIDPEWHPWLHHITLEPPHKDAVMQASRQPWQHKDVVENLTGTRGAYKPYPTQRVHINSWEPKVAKRS